MDDLNSPGLNVPHIMWWMGLNKAEDSSRFGHFGSNATRSSQYRQLGIYGHGTAGGSNSNTYRPVFALLQTHPRFSFFSACFIRIWEIIGHRHDKTSQATTSLRADWAKHEHLKAGMHVLFGR